MDTQHLILLAETYARFTNRSEATISSRVTSHARLFSRLRAGKGCTVQTLNSTMRWFAENWPSDLEWPASVPRPTPPRKKETAR